MASTLTVIIPARNASATIGRTLDALTPTEDGVEVVVVDDASSDATAVVAAEHGARVVSLEQQAGPGPARNAGVAATDAEYLAFTDADCEPSRLWLQAGLSALEAGADLVTGPIRSDPRAAFGPYDRSLHSGRLRLFESANLFVRRALFEQLGGFRNPERVRLKIEQGHFGEDVVFGWRAVRSGARVRHATDALVLHAVSPRGPRRYVAERLRLRLFPRLVAEVPELRRDLVLGLFLSPRTARFDAALVGGVLALSRRRPGVLVLCAAYVYSDLRLPRPWRRSEIKRAVTFSLADAVGLLALAWGGITSRTPVL